MEDLDSFYSFLADPASVRYMMFTEEQRTRDGAKQMLRWVIDAYDSNDPVFSLTIADPDTDRYLGSCGLNPDSGGGFEVYYTIVSADQGKGLATEASRAIVTYAIGTLGTRRLVAYVVLENAPSVRVAEKLGFTDDGPVDRSSGEAGMAHAELACRRYALLQ